jgi:hypothetical protein
VKKCSHFESPLGIDAGTVHTPHNTDLQFFPIHKLVCLSIKGAVTIELTSGDIALTGVSLTCERSRVT